MCIEQDDAQRPPVPLDSRRRYRRNRSRAVIRCAPKCLGSCRWALPDTQRYRAARRPSGRRDRAEFDLGGLSGESDAVTLLELAGFDRAVPGRTLIACHLYQQERGRADPSKNLERTWAAHGSFLPGRAPQKNELRFS